MTDDNKTNMASEEELKRLSHQINELIAACNALKSENTQLKAQQTSFNDEKSKWVDYQNEVKARVQLDGATSQDTRTKQLNPLPKD